MPTPRQVLHLLSRNELLALADAHRLMIGDVFFTREAPAGEACLVPDVPNLCMGQRMMYFRPRPGVLDARFLVHSIYGPVVRRHIEHACNGSTVGHLRLGQVAAIPLLRCPLVEQLSIAEHIEREAAPLELAITQAEREITLIREYCTRLIADVVTGQLDVRAAAARLPTSDPDEPAPADLDDATDDDLDEDEPE
ncbi:hypothetical protein WME75_07380 [Sorangium sp. So ce1014]|uniref:hypothetical protein n=1 Tax=Sorangium sp. So ce1014 TaxID=3133326 RepID=UPI003F61CFD0